MAALHNPFFWGLVSMLGMTMATSLFSSHKLKRSKVFVFFALLFVTVGRIILVLPCCPQPRFKTGVFFWLLGGAIMGLALIIALIPTIRVRWWEAPAEKMKLITTGVYAYIRHPIYFGEVAWFLGWAIIFGSLYGLFLAVVFWFAFFIHVLAEEAELERVLGKTYSRYKEKVRGRMFPFLPI